VLRLPGEGLAAGWNGVSVVVVVRRDGVNKSVEGL
jgi:hypothetical protein